jgi:phosphoribosyl 1,2-cyclic phosphodiesterase
MSFLSLCSLASGSSGNCTLVSTGQTHVLIDAGISLKRIATALEPLGLKPGDVQGVCVTHEHSDHIQALPLLHRKHGVPLYGNAGTIESLSRKAELRDLHWNIFSNGQVFSIGDITLRAYSVPHDGMDPVGYVIEAHGAKIGMATDIGLPTHVIRDALRGCHALVLETNHDVYMLEQSERPWSLKQRIAGRQGHLSNDQAAKLLAEIAGPELKRVYLAHLSQDCNQPGLAAGCIRRCLEQLGRSDIEIEHTYPDKPSAVWSSHKLCVPG